MKRYLNKTMKMLAVLVATLFFTVGCSDLFNNPLQDKETGEDLTLLLLDLNFFDTKLILKFEDFDTGDLLVGESISTIMVGAEADQFVTVFGEKKNEHTTSSGILELYLDPAYTFTDTPIELEIMAFSDPLRTSSPTSIEINEAGEQIVIVRMIDWSKSASVLKSAMTNVTIDVDQEGGTVREKNLEEASGANGYINLVEYFYIAPNDRYASSRAAYKNAYDSWMISYHRTGWQSFLDAAYTWLTLLNALPAPPATPDVILTATSISLDENTLEYWGFSNDIGKEITLKVGEKNHTTYKRSSISKCDNGLTIKVNAPDLPNGDKTSNSSFKYKITFSDNSTLNGQIGGSFDNLSTTGRKISPIYYPTADSKVSITLTENSQYTLEQATQNLDSPCGEVTFIAKKKPNLVDYKFLVTYSCDIAGLAYSGIGLFKNLSKGTQPEIFSLSTGGFSLKFEKGDRYEITVIIDNVPYSMTIDTNNIQGSLEGQSIDGNRIRKVTVNGSDDVGYNVKIDVVLTGDLCQKISG